MDINTEEFRVLEHSEINLAETQTTIEGSEKIEAVQRLAQLKTEMFELQEKLYAENKRSLLILFQAMDAAGKDSAIKHVMGGLNPQGCQVHSFKQPSSEELDHDFLWRHHKSLPERGRIGIHNRSHYENVLVCKVHPAFAANESKLPISEIDEQFWASKYKSIKAMEEHLTENGTVILKFFLHISKDEQKKRFLERIDDPSKNWKFAAGDLEERELWDKYMQAYEVAFKETSTEKCPWYIIPGDKKWFARTAICDIIVNTLKSMNPEYPTLTAAETVALQESKSRLLQTSG